MTANSGSLVILLTVLITGARALGLSASLDPAHDPNSFTNLVMSEKPNFVNSHVPAACLAVLKARAGRPIDSDLLPSYLVSVKDVPYQQTDDGLFFHYTDSVDALSDAAQGDPSKVFDFLRRPESRDPFLYLAADPVSSRSYGDGQILVRLNPDAKIFFPIAPSAYVETSRARDPNTTALDSTGTSRYQVTQVIHHIVEAIVAKDPTLYPCYMPVLGEKGASDILMLLALETEKIPLIAYFGTGVGWFQLVGAWGVESIEQGHDVPALTKEQSYLRAVNQQYKVRKHLP